MPKTNLNTAPSSIKFIEWKVNTTSVLLVIHHKEELSLIPEETYIYDRIHKRYYRLLDKCNKSSQPIKQRISEDIFHAVFNRYLEGEHH